ncbi:MAG: hypothetical protein Q7T82_02855 [Armatimonadota bacterium]|nr:hypothetical protein [Armatimonadota bacterium]
MMGKLGSIGSWIVGFRARRFINRLTWSYGFHIEYKSRAAAEQAWLSLVRTPDEAQKMFHAIARAYSALSQSEKDKAAIALRDLAARCPEIDDDTVHFFLAIPDNEVSEWTAHVLRQKAGDSTRLLPGKRELSDEQTERVELVVDKLLRVVDASTNTEARLAATYHLSGFAFLPQLMKKIEATLERVMDSSDGRLLDAALDELVSLKPAGDTSLIRWFDARVKRTDIGLVSAPLKMRLARQLGSLGDKRFLDVLSTMAQDSDRAVQMCAQESIQEIHESNRSTPE